jgi:hypothetical protein
VKKAIPAQLRQKKKYVSSMQSVSHSELLVDVWCKDVRTIRLGFGCFTDARKQVLSPTHSWSAARSCVHISSVTMQFVDAVRTHAPASVTGLFAFAYRPPKEEKYSNRLQLTTFTCDVITNRPTRKRYTEDKGWGVYDVIKEHNRIGIPSK